MQFARAAHAGLTPVDVIDELSQTDRLLAQAILSPGALREMRCIRCREELEHLAARATEAGG